ncbi:MAG TPA: hypothetical protein ENK47_00300 [Euryarchaeota archaeon]|nr:MAG: hypothetical protein DRN57_08745 [Thermoplasmata archaeon]HHD15129.1 hypothetical protein [Euryarchaeota archaeon]
MGLPKDLRRKVSKIEEDNVHGSVDIAVECCRLLSYNLEMNRERLRETALSLLEAQGSMAPVVNLVNQFLFALDEGGDLEELLRNYIEHLTTSVDRIAENSLQFLEGGKTVVTHSSGLTVKKALVLAHEKGLGPRVICTESRPNMEGRRLAEELREAGMDVTLVVDAAVFQELEDADIVFLGADSISLEGIVNKIGTKGIAQVARNLRKDVFVLAGTDKILPLGIKPYRKELKNIKEIYPGKLKLNVRNYYFDMTSIGLMKGFITEDGIMDIYQIMELIDRNIPHKELKKARGKWRNAP